MWAAWLNLWRVTVHIPPWIIMGFLSICSICTISQWWLSILLLTETTQAVRYQKPEPRRYIGEWLAAVCSAFSMLQTHWALFRCSELFIFYYVFLFFYDTLLERKHPWVHYRILNLFTSVRDAQTISLVAVWVVLWLNSSHLLLFFTRPSPLK